MKNKLSNAERETHLNMVADDRNYWTAFTDDPVMARKLERVGELIWTDGKSAKFRLEANQVRFFQRMTEEAKQNMAASLLDPPLSS